MALYDGFSHLVLPVADLERSEKFYREVFGLDLVGRNLVAEAEPNALLKSDCRQMVVLVETDKVKIERDGANSTHHAWLLKTPEEYHACVARLKAMGFEIEDYRAAFRAAGQYSVDIVDPDGHRFQIQSQGPEATEIKLPKKGKVRCGKARDHAVGSVTLFKEAQFFLLRLEQGFLALSQWCTHQNGLVAWRGNFYDFYCPKHGAVFLRNGESASVVMDLPPLRLHPLAIDDAGEIVVDTDRVVVRRGFAPDQLVPAEPGAALAVESLKSVREVA